MPATLDAFLTVLREGGTEAAQTWLSQQTARPMRDTDKALFDALEGFVSQVTDRTFDNPQRVPSAIYPFLIAASLTDDEIKHFYAEHPIPSWRLRFPVVLPSTERNIIDNAGGAVLAMAVSPNGCRVAASSKKGQTRAWQLPDPQPMQMPPNNVGHVLDLTWLDSHRLLLCANDGHVHVWDVQANEIMTLAHKHQLDVTCCATDGDHFITCGNDGVTAYWTSTDARPMVLSGQAGRFTSCALADQRVATGSTIGEVGLWNMTNPDCSFVVDAHEGPVTGCAFVADTQMLLTVGEDGRLMAWDVDSGEAVYTMDGQLGPISALAVDDAGLRALTGHASNQIALYDLVEAERLGVFLGHKRPISSVAFSPDALKVWSGSRDRTIRGWTMSDLRTPGVALHHASSVRTIHFSSDAKQMVSGCRDGDVQLWSVQTGERIRLFQGQKGSIYQIRFSADNQYLAAVATSGRILVWDTPSGEIVHTIDNGRQPVTCCAFTGDHTLITGSRNNQIQCWDLSTGTQTQSLTGHTDWVRTLAIHPDGKHLATGSYDNTVRIWDLTSGTQQRILTHHTRPVISCAITPDGEHLVSLGLDGQLVHWSWETGDKLHVIDAHDEPGAGLALYGDNHVVTVGQDCWARTFDLRTGSPVHQLPMPGSLDSVATAHGLVAIGDRTGNIWLFSIVDPVLLSTAHASSD